MAQLTSLVGKYHALARCDADAEMVWDRPAPSTPMHRQPRCRLFRRSALDAMFRVRRDVEPVARLHRNNRDLSADSVFKTQHRASREQADPFVLLLIIPESIDRGVALRDEAHDAEMAVTFREDLDEFFGHRGRDRFEEIRGVHPSPRMPDPPEFVDPKDG
jgi:hypothetical protein